MNKIFTHPGQPEMQAEVILASQGPDQKPIYTIRMRYPRIIHAEIMTHRVFSRNARSSRAVPVKAMLEEVRTKPFVPWHWGKNQSGMQANEECNEELLLDWDHSIGMEEWATREEAWLQLRDITAKTVEAYMNAGYHKQNPNRLLESFSWIDTLITATNWDNFLWLRDHKDAEPHIQDLARLVKQAIEKAEIQELQSGQWHLPYITQEDADAIGGQPPISNLPGHELLKRISAARCARISYKPFDGDSSYEKELARYDMLVSSDRVHASPTEHQATPDRSISDRTDPYGHWAQPHLHGNLDGYIQARKLIPNEAHHG